MVILTEEDGKTMLNLTGHPIHANAEQEVFYHSMFPSMEQGFGGTFDQLVAYLKSLECFTKIWV